LRNKIYEYLLCDTTWYLKDPGPHRPDRLTTLESKFRERDRKQPMFGDLELALTFVKTCRQIYGEARHMAFARSTFHAPDTKTLSKWVRRRTVDQRGAIATVEVPVHIVALSHGRHGFEEAPELILLSYLPALRSLRLVLSIRTTNSSEYVGLNEDLQGMITIITKMAKRMFPLVEVSTRVEEREVVKEGWAFAI
jgi:hypothetical protein